MLSGGGLLPLSRANDLLFFCEKQHDLVHVSSPWMQTGGWGYSSSSPSGYARDYVITLHFSAL